MRAVYVAALIVLLAAAVTVEQAKSHQPIDQTCSRLLLAQNVTNPQVQTGAPHAPADKSHAKQGSNNMKQKSDSATQPPADPGTTPWLGAPPQFQRTWPPTALPQSDENDDLLLMQAPRKPAKVHRA